MACAGLGEDCTPLISSLHNALFRAAAAVRVWDLFDSTASGESGGEPSRTLIARTACSSASRPLKQFAGVPFQELLQSSLCGFVQSCIRAESLQKLRQCAAFLLNDKGGVKHLL